MPENQQVESSSANDVDLSNSTSSIHEALTRLTIDNGSGGTGGHTSPFPLRPGQPDCSFYIRNGKCGYGANCKFNHPSNSGQIAQFRIDFPQRDGEPDCAYFLKTGTCKFGLSCKFHHPPDRHGAGPVVFNILGHPIRQEEKSCPHYMQTGNCKFGIACKFHHPQPSTAATPLSVPGPATYGSTGLPSSGGHYAGVKFPLSLQKPTYVSGIPSQAIIPTTGLNAYMGGLSEQAYLSVHLPKRENQPECRYFMNTGSCKYGSNCKYNHPIEKFNQLPANSFHLNGLPLRPGRVECANYMNTGICKYGPYCKYDHPYLEYPYNYNFNLPHTLPNQPIFPYQTNAQLIYSYEMPFVESPVFPSKMAKPEAENNSTVDGETPEEMPAPAGSPLRSLSI